MDDREVAREALIQDAQDLIDAGIGDPDRLDAIIGRLRRGRSLYNSDRMFLDRMTGMLERKMANMRRQNESESGRMRGVGPDVIIPTASLVTDEMIEAKIMEADSPRSRRRVAVAPRKRSMLSRIRERLSD